MAVGPPLHTLWITVWHPDPLLIGERQVRAVFLRVPDPPSSFRIKICNVRSRPLLFDKHFSTLR